MSVIPPGRWRPLFDAVYEMNTAKDHADLGGSLSTVKEYAANILAKLGQENRHAATVFALRSLNRS